MRTAVLLLAAALATSCASTTPAPPAARSLVLVSLDSFRPSELGRGRTPNLDAIARGGVVAEAMHPSYPSLTFPNHYTLVTGLRPDHHGIVHNTMQDPELGAFTISGNEAVGNARWWGGEPIWATAEKAGIRTATMFWPGSSAPIGGVRPSEWRTYDEHFPAVQRVDTALEWLGRPAPQRPRLVTLYFEALDEASHDFGPDSPQAHAAETELDGLMGRLRDGIAARGLAEQVDIVIVSDHGMAEVPPGHVVVVEDMAPADIATPVTAGQSVGFKLVAGHEADARRRLLGRHDHYECWNRESLPARWHYGTHPRIPPIVCQMDEGWDAETRARLGNKDRSHPRGSHGFDPALRSMDALFVADGPSFRDGLRLPAFDNVDVYPMLARLLGITPRPNDGDPRTLLPALREDR